MNNVIVIGEDMTKKTITVHLLSCFLPFSRCVVMIGDWHKLQTLES